MSVRLRVTLVFTAVMAGVLLGARLFLYLRLGHQLDARVERKLKGRAGVYASGDTDAIAQVLDPSGRVVRATAEAGRKPLLSAAELRRARRGVLTVDHRDADDHVRLRAEPSGGRIVVVGEDLDPREAAVSSLGTLLLIGGPITLLLAALAGYGATAAALRPVERMRARAAEIEAGEPGGRLPVPPPGDEIGRPGGTLHPMPERMEAAVARERTFLRAATP